MLNVNFPGEPYRDIGYPVWCTAVDNPLPVLPDGTHQCPAANAWSNCNGDPCRQGSGDSVFSCQDLQTGQPHNDGKCRIVSNDDRRPDRDAVWNCQQRS